MEKKRELKKRYDSTAEIYDERYFEIQLKKFRAIKSEIENVSRLLELGCGTGFFLEEFSRFSDEVYGVDFSIRMLEKARERSSGSFLICADADNLPFKNQTFETVVSLTLLQNMPDPTLTFAEISRVLKKDGKVITSILAKKISPDEMENQMNSANLKPLRIEKIPESEDLISVGKKVDYPSG